MRAYAITALFALTAAGAAQAALDRALAKAREVNADVVLANDPDADRHRGHRLDAVGEQPGGRRRGDQHRDAHQQPDGVEADDDAAALRAIQQVWPRIPVGATRVDDPSPALPRRRWRQAACTLLALAGGALAAADHTVSVFTNAATHIVADITGYITGPSSPAGTDGLFVPISPGRGYDSRTAPNTIHQHFNADPDRIRHRAGRRDADGDRPAAYEVWSRRGMTRFRRVVTADGSLGFETLEVVGSGAVKIQQSPMIRVAQDILR